MNTFRYLIYTSCAAIAALIVWDKLSNAEPTASSRRPAEVTSAGDAPSHPIPQKAVQSEGASPGPGYDTSERPEAEAATSGATPPPVVPQRKFAPKGTLYVVKPFSVSSEFGVYGFRVGTKVSVLREEGNTIMVFDGNKRGSATGDHFTNDLELVERLKTSGTPAVAREIR